ncbi:uncharacterized protein LOC119167439 [Rhipicephalus microplus]|uniref:uncharacterized protein LOC119167439 n=1 Tax=Rhipicephalus microplus TaxID=6941 RepID=UPI003F6A5BA1
MGLYSKLVFSAVVTLFLLGVNEASLEETSKKDLPEYCSKGGEIDWTAVLGKAFELYQSYSSKQTASRPRTPLDEILVAALSQKTDSAGPPSTGESAAKADAKDRAGQPDISAALLGSLLSNLGNAGASSQNSADADPMAGLKTMLDGLGALNGKESSSASAGGLDLSKLVPLIMQGLPSLLGSQGSGSQASVLSLLGSLMGNQQGGQGLEKMFSQLLKSIFSPDRQAKNGNLAEGLEPALSGVIESLLKAGLKEDTTKDATKDTESSTLRTEL